MNILKTFLEYLEFYIAAYWISFSPRKHGLSKTKTFPQMLLLETSNHSFYATQ